MDKTNSKSPVVDANRETVLAWFTGKARVNAFAALDLLAQSEALGEWVPKASRSVWAALSKSNVAKRIGLKNRGGLEAIGDYKSPESHRGWSVSFILDFGKFWGHGDVNFKAVHDAAPNVDLKLAVIECKRFVGEFAPITALLRRLDATRAKPVITYLGASPTVTKLLASLGLERTVATTARLCPVEWTTVERKNAKGKVIGYFQVGRTVWPEGTVHGASRYDHNREHDQCQACGHAIKTDNWVPLVVDNAAGVPHSLWVGRDCARTIFGIKVVGAFEIEGNSVAKDPR